MFLYLPLPLPAVYSQSIRLGEILFKNSQSMSLPYPLSSSDFSSYSEWKPKLFQWPFINWSISFSNVLPITDHTRLCLLVVLLTPPAFSHLRHFVLTDPCAQNILSPDSHALFPNRCHTIRKHSVTTLCKFTTQPHLPQYSWYLFSWSFSSLRYLP